MMIYDLQAKKVVKHLMLIGSLNKIFENCSCLMVLICLNFLQSKMFKLLTIRGSYESKNEEKLAEFGFFD